MNVWIYYCRVFHIDFCIPLCLGRFFLPFPFCVWCNRPMVMESVHLLLVWWGQSQSLCYPCDSTALDRGSMSLGQHIPSDLRSPFNGWTSLLSALLTLNSNLTLFSCLLNDYTWFPIPKMTLSEIFDTDPRNFWHLCLLTKQADFYVLYIHIYINAYKHFFYLSYNSILKPFECVYIDVSFS